MVTHRQCSSSLTCTGTHEASGNSDLHYPKQEVNGGIQQQACPRRVECASSDSFTSSCFSNPNSVVFPAMGSGHNLIVPHAFMTTSLANVQETPDYLSVNQGTTLPMMPGSSEGVEALSSYMEQLRLDPATFNNRSFVDYSSAKAGNPYQFRQATFYNYIPTQGFPDVNSWQYFTYPCVQTNPEIARATSPYDTRWIYRDSTAVQTRHKPLIRSATKRSSKHLHPRTRMPFKPFNVVKKPRVLRSRSCIDRRGDSSSSSNTNIGSSFHRMQVVEIRCNYGCGRVFSRADGCRRHMLYCPFRTEK